jgi:hypothetical protein
VEYDRKGEVWKKWRLGRKKRKEWRHRLFLTSSFLPSFRI